MKPSEVLRKAKELISTPDRWTRFAFARDQGGRPVGYYDTGAVCWCAEGAIALAADGIIMSVAARYWLARVISWSIPVWNDGLDGITTSHTEVMTKFDEAIALAEGEGL